MNLKYKVKNKVKLDGVILQKQQSFKTLVKHGETVM